MQLNFSDLIKSGKKGIGEKKEQFNGLKLSKEYVESLYKELNLSLDVTGAQAFDLMIQEVTGEEAAEPVSRTTDGSRFIGRKMSLELSDKSTVFNSHPKLCQTLGIPATAGGSEVFKALLAKWIEKRGS